MKPESFRDLMRIAHGFEGAKVFLVANDLDLFDTLVSPKCCEEVAKELNSDRRAIELLLNALVSLGLLEKGGSFYCNAPVSQQFLVAGPNYRGHIFKHISRCWRGWDRLAEVLKSGRPCLEEPVSKEEEERSRLDFILGMDDVTRELALEVVPQLPMDGVRVLLDVGAGPGTYAGVFLENCPELLEVRLFDFPPVLEIAAQRIEQKGFSDRVTLQAGDAEADDLGTGVDAIWVSQLFHSLGDRAARQLVDKAMAALNPGGRLIVHDFLLDDERVAPVSAALFGVHMLVLTESGRTYSGKEIAEWMTEAGFARAEYKQVSQDTSVVIGVKL